MVFDHPMWRWTLAEEEKDYGYVKNRVRVHTLTRGVVKYYVNVPTELFPALEVIGTDTQRARYRKNGLEFMLEEQKDGKWKFGIVDTDLGIGLSLWQYTAKTVPGWMVTGKV